MQTLSLPHPSNIRRTVAVLVAAAVLVAILVLALVDVTGGTTGSGAGSPAAPATQTAHHASSVSSTSCLYLDQPC
jgi:hypothetical protein